MTNSNSDLFKQANDTWLENWLLHFGNIHGGFHERLDKELNPIDLPRRLLSQCRMLNVYSLGFTQNPERAHYLEKINESFEFIKKNYFKPSVGGFIFSIHHDNKSESLHYDLYAHSFVILSFANYFKASKNLEALTLSRTCLYFILEQFSFKDGNGFYEALDENLTPIKSIRRQNPHMHLLEACLEMHNTSKDDAYKIVAKDISNLFFDYFFDAKTQTLGEFFEDDLSPHLQKGSQIETGHHGEWVWLLSSYKKIIKSNDKRLDETIKYLMDFVINKGVDFDKGGVFNIHERDGTILDHNKRIWTIFETYRACMIMGDKKTAQFCLNTICEHYIDTQTGWWHELVDEALSPISDFYPATTPYHIYPILREIELAQGQK